jgi:hypothetical protein
MRSWVDEQLDDPKVARAAFEETFKEYTEACKQRDEAVALLRESFKSDRAVAWLREYDARTGTAG